MPQTAFASPSNGIASNLALDYAKGSGVMALFDGTGAIINAGLAAQGLPSISPTAPYRYQVARVRAVNLQTGDIINTAESAIYLATGLSGDALSGVTATEGTTDQNFYAGDIFRVDLTAGQVVAEQTAINALESAVSTLQAAPIFTGIPTATEFLSIDSSTTVYNSDGSIVTTHGSGLVETTTFTATTIVTRFTGPKTATQTITFNADGSTSEEWL